MTFDPCYLAPCDDIDNLNAEALDEMSDAAPAVPTFAQTTSSVNGTDKGSGPPSSSFEYKSPHPQK